MVHFVYGTIFSSGFDTDTDWVLYRVVFTAAGQCMWVKLKINYNINEGTFQQVQQCGSFLCSFNISGGSEHRKHDTTQKTHPSEVIKSVHCWFWSFHKTC